MIGICSNTVSAKKVTKKSKLNVDLCVNSKKLIRAVIQSENPCRNPHDVGDNHLRHKAYGLLQIRKPYLDDVNQIAGKKEIRRLWGKNKLTVQDMKSQKKAEWAFRVYMSYYGKVYKHKTRKVPTIEVYARMHNGGPVGWKKKSTKKYGKAVVRYVQKNRVRKYG
ncbi:MAG: hypothetical protein ABIF22_02835 [bacterium]